MCTYMLKKKKKKNEHNTALHRTARNRARCAAEYSLHFLQTARTTFVAVLATRFHSYPCPRLVVTHCHRDTKQRRHEPGKGRGRGGRGDSLYSIGADQSMQQQNKRKPPRTTRVCLPMPTPFLICEQRKGGGGGEGS